MTAHQAAAPAAKTGSKQPHELDDRQRALAFFTVLTAVVLEVADTTIVNTALPAIRDGLGASPAAMQWIVAGYLLTLGSLLLLGGRLGDAFGHNRMFLGGVAGFVAASALCGLAPTPGILVLARVLQGAAGAMMGPQTMAIVQLLYTPLERVRRLAFFGMIIGLAAILGPILGGFLIELNLFGLGWRLIFLINLPVGLFALAMGRLTLPRTGEEHRGLAIDLFGAALFAIGFGLILLALIQAHDDLGAGRAAAILGGGIAAVGLAVRRAILRRAAGLPAMIEPALFALPTFRWGVIAAMAFNSASVGFLLIFAVALQQGLALNPLQTALIHIPFGLGVMLAVGLMVPRLLPRLGRVLPMAGGMLMAIGIVGSLALIHAAVAGGPLLAATLALAGIGFGTLSGPLGPIVVSDVPRTHAGTASATMRTAQQLGGALGIALVGSAYFAVAGQDATARLAGLLPGGLMVSALLTISVLAVSRLPATLFAAERKAAAD
ncbi:MFS transporter [Novosphingobium sp. PASSN1]|uniref:MFS transporter n=1 Tax=Novosphingobium sp. PASSN1 TaxID=2015561 RepID=UPI000BC7F6F6|nr:MFS transporter [Novosphingobium sp. PASSN1]OYU35419.1 MAG: MFS transporter [Novosphingobium sp. PASSN1]